MNKLQKGLAYLTLASAALITGCSDNGPSKREEALLKVRAHEAAVHPSNLLALARNTQIPTDSLIAYDDRFIWGLKRDEAVGYDYGMKRAFKKGLTPSIANQYNKRFTLRDALIFHEVGIDPAVANKYASWSGEIIDVPLLIEKDISFEDASRYNSRRFKPKDIVSLNDAGISGGLANEYPRGLSCWDIIKLHSNGISSDEIKSYAQLNKRFDSNIGVEDVIKFKRMGLSYGEIEERVKDAIIDDMITN